MHKKGLIYTIFIVCSISNLFSQQNNNQIRAIKNIYSTQYLNQNNYRKDKSNVWDNNNYFFCEPNSLNKTKNQKKQVKVDFTFTFDLPYPSIYMVSSDTYYWTEFNFINPYKAHYTIDEGEYDVLIQFKYDSSITIITYRFVIHNNIQVDSLHTTLFVSQEQANKTILFKGVDANNNILWGKQNYHNEYWIVFNPENSFTTYYAGVESFDNGFYISDLFNSAEILISEMIIDTKENNEILNLQHNVITKIPNNVTEVTNSPEIYTKQYIEINQPAGNDLQDIYFSNVLLETKNNHTSSGIYALWNSISFTNQNKWEGIFYLTPDYNSHYANSIISIYNNGYNLTFYRSFNNSFTIFSSQLPTADLYLSPNNDTTILGKGLMYFKNNFNNNLTDNYYIDISPELFSYMKDEHYLQNNEFVFNLYDSTGQLIKSTNTGWDVTQKYYTPAGKYTVEFTDTN
ncbi:MAG: hypothetical protein GXO79_00730, partial [Chlorobi bacterium]|nr:hypothetical protein [Chlorobiota bacterium]